MYGAIAPRQVQLAASHRLIRGYDLCNVGGYEACLAGWFFKSPVPQLVRAVISTPTYNQSHLLLGYTLQKNCRTQVTKYYDKKLLYDVTYTIDVNGWRVVPCPSPDSATAVAFFGCSYTLGEGVNDNETLPYRFAEKSGDRFKAFNFGIHGYGPHQMLAILKNELENPPSARGGLATPFIELLVTTSLVAPDRAPLPTLIYMSGS